MPKWLYTDTALEGMRSDKFSGWNAKPPVRWLTTNVNLARPHSYDHRDDHFDCLVQYRVDALDNIAFNGVRAGELVVPKTSNNPKRTTLLEAADRAVGSRVPDDGLSLGRIVTVDAIYHDCWCAIPFSWPCPRESVFGDEAWEQLLQGITIEQIRSGSTVLTPISNVTSSRVTLYATAHHAMWRVGQWSFFVPVHKRVPHTMLDPTRMPEGWSENVARYEHPVIAGVPVDPPKRVKGVTMKTKEGDATAAIHTEMLRHGILMGST